MWREGVMTLCSISIISYDRSTNFLCLCILILHVCTVWLLQGKVIKTMHELQNSEEEV